MSLDVYKRLHMDDRYGLSKKLKQLDYEAIDSGEIIEKLKEEIEKLEEEIKVLRKEIKEAYDEKSRELKRRSFGFLIPLCVSFMIEGLMFISLVAMVIILIAIISYNGEMNSKIQEKERRLRNKNENIKENREYIKLSEEIKPFARGVLEGNTEAYIKTFDVVEPILPIKKYLNYISLYTTSRGNLGVTITAEKDNVPKYTKRYVKRGPNPGERKDYLSNTAFNLLYQTYMSSCALRIANDIFFVFPNLNAFVVNVKNKEGVKISVIMQRDRIVGVYRESPQELLRELPHHNISFSARNGAYNVDMLDFR